MKIISWNVNGIRAVAKKGFKDFIISENPDILCLQETKAFEDQFLKDVGELEGYNYIWHSGERAGYAGTVIFYKKNIEIISTKNLFDEIEHFHSDGRFTEIEFKRNGENTPGKKCSRSVILMNGYFPNGGTRANGQEMLTYKLEFYDKLIDYTRKIKSSGKDIIITGDFNICHSEIDIARPKANVNSIGFLPIEREKIGELINDDNIDVWRYFYPDKLDIYSWWSYRAGARANNVGWRIDYFVVNKDFIDNVENIHYLTETMGSDHCPVMLELK